MDPVHCKNNRWDHLFCNNKAVLFGTHLRIKVVPWKPFNNFLRAQNFVFKVVLVTCCLTVLDQLLSHCQTACLMYAWNATALLKAFKQLPRSPKQWNILLAC
jgi:hypothetical protein